MKVEVFVFESEHCFCFFKFKGFLTLDKIRFLGHHLMGTTVGTAVLPISMSNMSVRLHLENTGNVYAV